MEAEKLCNRIAVMNKGKIVAVDTPLRLSEVTRDFRGVKVTLLGPAEVAVGLLETVEGVKSVVKVEPEEEYTTIQLKVDDEESAMITIPQRLKSNGIKLIGIQRALPSLEEVFIRLTGEEVGT